MNSQINGFAKLWMMFFHSMSEMCLYFTTFTHWTIFSDLQRADVLYHDFLSAFLQTDFSTVL